MSDFTPEAPVEAEATGDLAPAETDVDWESRYRAEVEDRKRDRERYRPVADVFRNLHPEDARAILDMANAYANGDSETAAKWMIDNARTLAGDRFETFISPAQQAATSVQLGA